MMTTLYVVCAPKRRTHVVSVDGMSLCEHRVNHAAAIGGVTEIDMAGGATTRVIADFRRAFSDNTCCKRCTRILRMLLLCHVTRDNGTRRVKTRDEFGRFH